jgi:hypothetical protein
LSGEDVAGKQEYKKLTDLIFHCWYRDYLLRINGDAKLRLSVKGRQRNRENDLL